jgi:hypothetical protein
MHSIAHLIITLNLTHRVNEEADSFSPILSELEVFFKCSYKVISVEKETLNTYNSGTNNSNS